jgi:hypothetical protein
MKKIVFVVLLFAGELTFAQSKVYFNTEMAVDFIDLSVYAAPNVNITINNHCIGLGPSIWIHSLYLDGFGFHFPGIYTFYQYKISRKKMDYFFQYNFGYNFEKTEYTTGYYYPEIWDTGKTIKIRNHVGVGINYHVFQKFYLNSSINYGVMTNLYLYDNHSEYDSDELEYGGFVRIGIGYSFRK